jgi:predicted nucleic acid binding AN1-type Zn finger protein
MQTAKEYLALAERCRSAKLDTRDRTARYHLETLERSYRMLAESTAVLNRSRKVQKSAGKGPQVKIGKACCLPHRCRCGRELTNLCREVEILLPNVAVAAAS